jgi:hypothetical protein
MRQFRGQLYWEGNVVLEDIRGTVQVHQPLVSSRLHPGPWSGEFELPVGRTAQAGGPYELRLSDGRVGQILVQRSAVSEEQPVQVAFLGCGPLRKASQN